jgi:hypothetical protein
MYNVVWQQLVKPTAFFEVFGWSKNPGFLWLAIPEQKKVHVHACVYAISFFCVQRSPGFLDQSETSMNALG